MSNIFICGRLSEIQSDQNPVLVQAIAELLPEINSKAGTSASKMNLVCYKTQIVAGTNYFAKLQLDDSEAYLHARIFQELPVTWVHSSTGSMGIGGYPVTGGTFRLD